MRKSTCRETWTSLAQRWTDFGYLMNGFSLVFLNFLIRVTANLDSELPDADRRGVSNNLKSWRSANTARTAERMRHGAHAGKAARHTQGAAKASVGLILDPCEWFVRFGTRKSLHVAEQARGARSPTRFLRPSGFLSDNRRVKKNSLSKIRVAGLWVRGKQILLEATVGTQLWGIPGGRLENGETIESGCVREFKEELGVEMRCRSLAIVAEQWRMAPHFCHELAFYFRVSPRFPEKVDVDHLRSREKEIEFRWFRLDELDEIHFVPKALVPLLQGLKKSGVVCCSSSYQEAKVISNRPRRSCGPMFEISQGLGQREP